MKSLFPGVAVWLGATAPVLWAQDKPEPVETKPMEVPHSMARNLGDRRIVVDGSLEDWPRSSPLLLLDTRQVSGTAFRSYLGPSDLSAQAFLVWDTSDLYVAVKVKDDWHRPLGARTYGVDEIPPADNVMLTFDPKRDTRAYGRDLGRSDDREFWLADVPGAGKGRVVCWDRFRGTAGYVDGGALAVTRDEKLKVTTYEVRLPWSSILTADIEPAIGTILDLQVVVNDLDEVTDVMPQTRVGWTFGVGPRIDPGLFGSFVLLGDVDGPHIDLPEFPSPPPAKEDPVPGPRYWVEFYEQLRATEPKPYEAADGDPRVALGARLRALETLESHVAAFPRVDFLEFQQRIHRRMSRECAGIVATGLPYFWNYVLADVRRRVEAATPEAGFVLFRLPQGGWIVLSKQAKFAIDPAGYGVEHLFYEVLDFVLLTSPLDSTKRNDQLLVRMLLTGRTLATHIGFHLPAIEAGKLAIAEVGQGYDTKGLRISVLGDKDADGNLPLSVGYHVRWPDGVVLVHSGKSSVASQAPRDGGDVDLLILSADHVAPVAAAHGFAPKLTVLDDVLTCSTRPGGHGRITLEQAFDLQSNLRANRSVIVGPGELLRVSR
ncbi:MAG: hypothetical protein R3F56_22550 [Planctomycetota bacterium]